MKDIAVIVKYEWEDEKGNIHPCRIQIHDNYESELEAVIDFLGKLYEDNAEWQVNYQTRRGRKFNIQTLELKKDEEGMQ